MFRNLTVLGINYMKMKSILTPWYIILISLFCLGSLILRMKMIGRVEITYTIIMKKVIYV